MVSVRSVLVVIGVAFTAYLAARGLWWTGPVSAPVLLVAAIVLYVLVTWAWIFWGIVPRRSGGSVPAWLGVITVVAAVAVPSLLMLAVPEAGRYEPYATWAIGGFGALATIVMVRARPVYAWLTVAAMGAAYAVWIGVLDVLVYGLIGSLVWVAVAQLTLVYMQRTTRDTQKLAALQQAASAWQAVHAGRAHERRMHVRRALAEAGPILSRVIVTRGSLSPQERRAALLAEWRLRDELRASRLLDEHVRAAVDTLRQRGATVTLLDEGGLEGLSDDALARIRAELAAALTGVRSARVFVRTSPDERIAVTVVGRSASAEGLSDEDTVELWREIAHPTADA